MSAKPILFSAPMMRALADGSKTQTRRVVKPQPPSLEHARTEATSLWWDGRVCPYGQPGDLLWVRETWAHYQTVSAVTRPGGRFSEEISDGLAGYRADGFDTIEDFRDHVRLMSDDSFVAVEINGDRWRPSIHMPRWASRYTLRLTDVRVERVQDISGVDAVAEGCAQGMPEFELLHFGGYGKARREFRELWDSLNAARGFGWEANPWVWALSFDVLAENVDAVLARAAA